jgi:myo-inositol-1(or 4)-monophosphatase
VSALLDAAEHIARRAGALLLDKLAEARTVDFKGQGRINLVTDADTASEALILAELRAHFPEHAVLAEESGASGHGTFTWLVDPLDGTTNYAHGVPHFCVSLAVEGPVETGGTGLLAGVVFDPTRGECFTAARGQGAFLNGKRLAVSAVESLQLALVCTGFSYDVHERPDLPLALFSRVLRRARGVRRMGSAALELAWLAAGRFDGFFELGLKPWDVAAGALLIQEAGGVIRRIDGAPFDVRCGDLLAGGPALADALEAECRVVLEAQGWRPRRFGAPAPH